MEAEQRAEQRAEEDTKIRMSKIPAKLVWLRTVGYVSRTHSAMGPSSVRIIPRGSDLVVADWSVSRTPPIWLSSLTLPTQLNLGYHKLASLTAPDFFTNMHGSKAAKDTDESEYSGRRKTLLPRLASSKDWRQWAGSGACP